MDKALGLDVSVWNGKINFNKMVQNGASFVFIKASQFIVDKNFKYNWKAAKDAGILRGSYHYLDWRKDETEQAKLFVSCLKNDPGELPPICDYEMRGFAPSREIAQGKLWNFMTYVENELGIVPGIYTGYYYWNDFGTSNLAWIKYPLWLAWWRVPEYVVKVPSPWLVWDFWQDNDKGDGIAFGCESAQVDTDWFRGSVEELKVYANAPSTPTIPEPRVCPTCLRPWPEAPENIYKVNINLANVRSGPGGTFPVIGTVKRDTIVTVKNISNSYSETELGWIYSLYLTKI